MDSAPKPVKRTWLDPKPAADSLYRCVVDGDTTRYLIAYRAATLLPFPATTRDDGSTPNKFIPLTKTNDSDVGIRIAETWSAQSDHDLKLTTKNVEIHAEDL